VTHVHGYVHNVCTYVAMTYICFRTRIRAVLATKRDTRAAIMTVTCTVFGLRCSRDSVRIPCRWRKWISNMTPSTEHVRRKFSRVRSYYMRRRTEVSELKRACPNTHE